MDADIRALTKKTDDLTRGVNRLTNALEEFSKNFVEFHKMVKLELEGDDVSGPGADPLEPRHETVL